MIRLSESSLEFCKNSIVRRAAGLNVLDCHVDVIQQTIEKENNLSRLSGHAYSSTILYFLVFKNSDYFYIVHEKAIFIVYILCAKYWSYSFIIYWLIHLGGREKT